MSFKEIKPAINKDTLEYRIDDFFIHTHTEKDAEETELLIELDRVIKSTFNRLVDSLEGKKVVLFLSGGYDSRLIAVNLKALGYENVLCLSMGYEFDREVVCAKSVAEQLGYEWRLFGYTQKYWKNKRNDQKFWDLVRHCSNDCGIPYIQGYVIRELIEKGEIPKDSVIITGNSGDVVEGNDVSLNFMEDKEYSKEELLKEIFDTHYYLIGRQTQSKCAFNKKLEAYLKQDIYTKEEAQDLIELFNWRERQAKFVVTDVRMYENYENLSWRLPLWDNEFVDYWLNVPYSYREKRKLYYKYVEEETFETANVVTKGRRFVDFFKKRFKIITTLMYPLKKIVEYFYPYCSYSYYGLIDFLKYCRLLKYTGGKRTGVVTVIGVQMIANAFGISWKEIKSLIRRAK